MSYTGLILPHKKPRTTHKNVFALFVILSAVYVVGMLGLQLFSAQDTNNKLASRLAGFSAKATDVSAPIVTPSAKDQQSNFAPIDKAQAAELIGKISSLALVPGDEAPTLATVIATEKLQKDLFFRNVEVGDQLIVFERAGLAIIYRPSAEKLVALGNINTGNSGGQAKGATSVKPTEKPMMTLIPTRPEAEIRVAVYYAANAPEQKEDIAIKLHDLAPNARIVSESPVVSGIKYDETTIIDLKGNQTELTKKIADVLGGMPGVEAQGEVLPKDADILIIIAAK